MCTGTGRESGPDAFEACVELKSIGLLQDSAVSGIP